MASGSSVAADRFRQCWHLRRWGSSAVTIDTLASIAGAERYEFEGFGTTGVASEIVVVFLNSPDKSKVVGISAEAPQGTMTSSEANAALRTLRFDG